MKVSDLKANPKNPRKITDKRLNQLSKAVEEFGDLSGIVFNRKTGNLISGHQRTKLFEKDSEVTIDVTHKKPTKVGTVAEGFVILRGERFPYREVSWDETREKAATIAANKSAGEWDNDILSDWFTDIDDMGMDLNLTMFDEHDRKKYIFDLNTPGSESDQGKLDQKSRSASDDIKGVNLTFTDDAEKEFSELVKFFQFEYSTTSISDTVLRAMSELQSIHKGRGQSPIPVQLINAPVTKIRKSK